ncbi:DUF2155 domain-containing protein [Asticcacaulis sp. AC402]|uniref:DUF2155 domain-containing protein n=1 Tax=Asticcacaulis sp. AC402 TaxID=1282361 RepID=UPI0003C3AE01|nr:DUF2155 domain-containing protein [Asticcacaulis sp. AC402]ESQ75271.1 hypothetical protein ABAC402_09205 [Asticcacaulis sp. AC402]
MVQRAQMKVSGKVPWAVVGVVALCAVVSASAQTAPPTRGDGGRQVPRYVDDADYDPQPYYVDGVEYKPYTPEKKKAAKPAATTAAPAPQPATPAAPVQELKPYVPPAGVQAQAEPEAKPKAASSASSSSSSSSGVAYVNKKRPRYGTAIIEALDKINAESVRFEAPIGQPVRYKGLIYLVKACETTADDEAHSDVMAYMTVRTNPLPATNTSAGTKSRQVFQGWSFASTPSLNPMQHPIYDAWIIGCRKPLGGTAS